MTKIQKITLVISVVLGLTMLGGALYYSSNQAKNHDSVPTVRQHPVSKTELAKANGKNGHICYVAVDGTVYQIKDFSLWQNGEHTTSNGLAYCGADLSKVIDQSPHGRKILEILIKIGPLKN